MRFIHKMAQDPKRGQANPQKRTENTAPDTVTRAIYANYSGWVRKCLFVPRPPARMGRCLMSTGHLAAAGFKEEPRPSFRLIDPDFDQTRRGQVAMFFADVVGFA